MVYRIAGGIFLTLLGLQFFGISIPPSIMGVIGILAGVALLAGL